MPDTPAPPVKNTDLDTIHLVIKGAILLAVLSLVIGAGGTVFFILTGHTDGAVITGILGLLAVPNSTIVALFALLARTSTTADPVTIANTPDDPVSVHETPPAPDADPVISANTASGANVSPT